MVDCHDCRYSLLKSPFDYHSPLYCYNPYSSHTNSYWTNCADARSLYGCCGSTAQNFKPKVKK